MKLDTVLQAEGLVLLRSQPYSWKVFHSQDSDPVENMHYRWVKLVELPGLNWAETAVSEVLSEHDL